MGELGCGCNGVGKSSDNSEETVVGTVSKVRVLRFRGKETVKGEGDGETIEGVEIGEGG